MQSGPSRIARVSDVQILRADDPRVAVLASTGYRLVGESWGARLRLSDAPDLDHLRRAVTRAEEAGFEIRELTPEYANALYELEVANNADYPFTPATFQPPPELEAIRGLWVSGKRVFGALHGDRLVAAVVWQVASTTADNDFASVLAAYRGQGLGSAVAASSISAFSAEGIRLFTAGGAATNRASLGLVRSMGFEVDEQWVSYQRDSVAPD